LLPGGGTHDAKADNHQRPGSRLANKRLIRAAFAEGVLGPMSADENERAVRALSFSIGLIQSILLSIFSHNLVCEGIY
jgi:hypothetical protein